MNEGIKVDHINRFHHYVVATDNHICEISKPRCCHYKLKRRKK